MYFQFFLIAIANAAPTGNPFDPNYKAPSAPQGTVTSLTAASQWRADQLFQDLAPSLNKQPAASRALPTIQQIADSLSMAKLYYDKRRKDMALQATAKRNELDSWYAQVPPEQQNQALQKYQELYNYWKQHFEHQYSLINAEEAKEQQNINNGNLFTPPTMNPLYAMQSGAQNTGQYALPAPQTAQYQRGYPQPQQVGLAQQQQQGYAQQFGLGQQQQAHQQQGYTQLLYPQQQQPAPQPSAPPLPQQDTVTPPQTQAKPSDACPPRNRRKKTSQKIKTTTKRRLDKLNG